MTENKKIDLYYTAKRKKDYITVLAVSFFVMILIFELLLVLWLPFYLRSRSLWDREAAREEMIELYDNLRANLSSIAKRHTGHEAKQINLAYESLNQLANYLRKNSNKLNAKQIHEMKKNLEEFEFLYKRMRIGKLSPESVVIDPHKYMMDQAMANDITLPEIKQEPEAAPEENTKLSKKSAGKTKDEKRKTK